MKTWPLSKFTGSTQSAARDIDMQTLDHKLEEREPSGPEQLRRLLMVSVSIRWWEADRNLVILLIDS